MPDGVAAVADLLFSGVSERPMWGRFLHALTLRLHGQAAALIIAADDGDGEPRAILVPDGCDAAGFSAIAGLPHLAELALDQPCALAGSNAVTLRMRLPGGRSIWLVIRAAPDGVGLAEDWHAILTALLPLMQRITPLYLEIGQAERRRLIAEHVLETSGVGVILVDEEARVVSINETAHRIIKDGGVLSLSQGQLRAKRSADQQLLLQHVRRKAGEQRAQAGRDRHATLALLRDDNALPVTVMIRPGPPFAPVSAPLRRTATIILRDPARRLNLASADLMQLFQLTQAEARLACLLADGASLEESALQLGVTRNTARSQLQTIFAKTGTNRQGDLVRLLLSSAAALAQRDGGGTAD
jgi:DNA-binding CsgD family transcriptional regulator